MPYLLVSFSDMDFAPLFLNNLIEEHGVLCLLFDLK